MKKRVTFLTAVCLFILCGFAMAQQDITVKGHVQDKQGTSLPGVSVKIKGTNRGTTTQADGNFSIEAPSTGTLEISYVGYEGQNIALNGRTQLSISLADTKTDLSEVVVIGYGIQKKKDVTT